MDIPNELWLSVFEFVDYFDLKRCQRVNKHFNALIKSTKKLAEKNACRSDDLPFKCYIETRYVQAFHPRFHPALQSLHIRHVGSQYELCSRRIRDARGDNDTKLYHLGAVRQEPAVVPLTKSVCFEIICEKYRHHFFEYNRCYVANDLGVTVGDMLRQFDHMLCHSARSNCAGKAQIHTLQLLYVRRREGQWLFFWRRSFQADQRIESPEDVQPEEEPRSSSKTKIEPTLNVQADGQIGFVEVKSKAMNIAVKNESPKRKAKSDTTSNKRGRRT